MRWGKARTWGRCRCRVWRVEVSDDEAAPSQRCRRCRWEGKAAVAAVCDDVGEGEDGVLY